MLDDAELLRRYTQRQDESAFAELVARHVNLVYSAALRQTGGDSHLAQDVAQKVFTDLARKARSLVQSLQRGKPLVGWLYTSTRFAASRLRRTEHRRQSRELVAHAMNEPLQPAHSEPEPAWSDLRPLLDEAMSELSDADRDAVLLRYFEGKELREVGAVLGLSDEAARKRIIRAIERLREWLAARGIKTTSAALTVTLTAQAVQIAPGGLATNLTRASLAATALTVTTATSTFGFLALMTTNFKIIISIATASLSIGTVVYRAHRQNQEKAVRPLTSAINAPVSQGILNDDTSRLRSKPAPELANSRITAALARIRAALAEPGRAPRYPQPEMEQAIRELNSEQRLATPILREALHHPDWEVRRRAASGIEILNGDASEAGPDLIEMLREAPTSLDVSFAYTALESVGAKGDMLPDLIDVLRENPEARTMVANLIPTLVKEGSKEALDAADQLRPLLEDPDQELQAEAGRALSQILKAAAGGGLLEKAIANLKAENENTRLSGLSVIDNLSPLATNAIPALKDFITQSNREDLKVYAEKILRGIDANYRQERDDPAFQEAQTERARAFAEKARSGQATVPELIAALRELPQAIPDAAHALGAIGYEEMSRKVHESPEAMQQFMSATIMLTQIAASNEPLETRLAASEAFQKLQPDREKLLYTVEEAAPAFAVITNALPRLSGGAREQVESRFGNMMASARQMWTVLKRPGDVTDYQGQFLETCARDLAKFDQRTYHEFVAAMRKSDPKFLQRP